MEIWRVCMLWTSPLLLYSSPLSLWPLPLSWPEIFASHYSLHRSERARAQDRRQFPLLAWRWPGEYRLAYLTWLFIITNSSHDFFNINRSAMTCVVVSSPVAPVSLCQQNRHCGKTWASGSFLSRLSAATWSPNINPITPCLDRPFGWMQT